ncbi:hypothetical protein KAW18_02530 [candidate division WOR-3 bacterium]|nr:hypothetical protein [candidate division WOR-3 bacterium]
MEINQDGKDCVITLYGETRCLSDCNCIKLANTLYGLPGMKYNEEDMKRFGLKIRE